MISEKYWDNTYKTFKGDSKLTCNPSTFARFCENFIPEGNNSIVDIGCGNGRDSLYFNRLGHSIFLLDKSKEALNLIPGNIPKQQVDLEKKFKTLKLPVEVKCVYSRFSLHSLTRQTQKDILTWAYNTLVKGGIVLIETRSEKDNKFGQGTKISEFEYVGTHYRRFQTMEYLINELKNIGFKISHQSETIVKGSSPEEDANVLRLIAFK